MGTQLGALSVRYRDNTGPGIAYATAMFPGDGNYTASGAEQTFLNGGPTTVTVTCASGSTYTGSALTPCTATAKADDGFSSTPLVVTYGNNVNAGTATATARYAGDGAGHLGSLGTATFTIAKAPSVVTVECAPASVVYTGEAFTPCTSTVTGAGNLAAVGAPVTYSSNTGAGTATAAARMPVTATTSEPPAAPPSPSRRPPSSSRSPARPPPTAPPPPPPADPVWPPPSRSPIPATPIPAPPPPPSPVTPTTSAAPPPPPSRSSGSPSRATTHPSGPSTPPPSGTSPGPATSGDAAISYDTRSGQFTERWKTAKGVTGCFRVTTTTADHSQLTAYFILL